MKEKQVKREVDKAYDSLKELIELHGGLEVLKAAQDDKIAKTIVDLHLHISAAQIILNSW